MIPFPSLRIPKPTPPTPFPFPFLSPSLPQPSKHRPLRFPPTGSNFSFSHPANQNPLPQPQPQPPRTLFPGGYKRPEIKVPSLLLHLDPDDVVPGGASLDLIDKAVSKSVGIVVLNGGGTSSGKRLYDAACLVKSVVRDRAYFLIAERVDIASAVNASGVVLSDQGLPTIVARNMMMDSKPESVVLPLVARNVETPNAALTASNYEGADFLIYSPSQDQETSFLVEGGVKTPVFVANSSRGGNDASLSKDAARVLSLGGSGLVVSLDDLRVFGEDFFGHLFNTVNVIDGSSLAQVGSVGNCNVMDVEKEEGEKMVVGFVRVKDKEKELVERERLVLLEAIDVIRKAAPLMEEVSLLVDAVSQMDEPFMLAIVGEFNSGKSTFINALLGERYLKEGVVPTTNEITFLCYSEYNAGEQQRCERHPDGQYVCYLPAPILREMNIIDTPGTNVILQRQQRLTEEFVPRADLLLFVISADRPLTESEVSFLRYTQQWKKKVVFVLNKSDLYQNASELEEAMSFIKENTRKLLNADDVILYPVSSRSALAAKLSASSDGKDHNQLSVLEPHWKVSSFYELEQFLYSFLDGSTSPGMERMKLKLETPIRIAERLLSACETLVKRDCEYAKQDLTSIIDTMDSVKEYATRMENESIFWRRKTLSLIDSTKSRVVDIIQSTLQLSNLDLVASYIFRGGNSGAIPASLMVQNDIVGPALLEAQKLLGEYVAWLQSNNAREGKLFTESFENRWPSSINRNPVMHIEIYESLRKQDDLCLRAIENLSSSTTSNLFDQEIREVFLGTFGGLGAAGLSASLLTSVLPTTLEDLLALGLCSAGGYIAILIFPGRRKDMIGKVNRIADDMAQNVEEAMRKDLEETVGKLEKFVKTIGEPYRDAAEERLDKLLDIQGELSNVEKKIKTLQVEIQNLHVL